MLAIFANFYSIGSINKVIKLFIYNTIYTYLNNENTNISFHNLLPQFYLKFEHKERKDRCIILKPRTTSVLTIYILST